MIIVQDRSLEMAEMLEQEMDLLTVGVREQCDKCSARAQFGAFFDTGVLTFCAHHYNEQADALTKSGAVVKMILI
jgi:hypothetical protein